MSKIIPSKEHRGVFCIACDARLAHVPVNVGKVYRRTCRNSSCKTVTLVRVTNRSVETERAPTIARVKFEKFREYANTNISDPDERFFQLTVAQRTMYRREKRPVNFRVVTEMILDELMDVKMTDT